MLKQIRPALVFVLGLTLLTGIIYPLTMTGLAGAIFPAQAGGSLIERNRQVIGSALIGQEFKEQRYFHGRLSATLEPDPNDNTKTISAPYNAANSGGSNLGPTSQSLSDRMMADMESLKAENASAPVPPDLVTTSASGLDPDISPEAAQFQIPRIAQARNIPEKEVRDLVSAYTKGRIFGLLGEPRVNVLALNMALDARPSR